MSTLFDAPMALESRAHRERKTKSEKFRLGTHYDLVRDISANEPLPECLRVSGSVGTGHNKCRRKTIGKKGDLTGIFSFS